MTEQQGEQLALVDGEPFRFPILAPIVYPLIRPNLLSEASHEVALGLAMMNFRVAPLFGIRDGRCTCDGRPRNGQECSPGKHPKVSFTRAATSDFETLQELMINPYSWTGDRRNNWAVATGLGSNVLIIDLDGEQGFESWEAFQKQFGEAPATVRSKSGRAGPGEHIWFALDPERPEPTNRASTRIGPGVDVRGQNGYAVIPGSLHLSGNRYRFLDGFSPEDVELAMLPDAYYEQLAGPAPASAKTSAKDVSAPTRQTASAPTHAPHEGSFRIGDGHGGFDNPLYRWACRYFYEEGADADAAPLVAALKTAIGNARKSETRDVTRYLSDDYLVRRSGQAREFIENAGGGGQRGRSDSNVLEELIALNTSAERHDPDRRATYASPRGDNVVQLHPRADEGARHVVSAAATDAVKRRDEARRTYQAAIEELTKPPLGAEVEKVADLVETAALGATDHQNAKDAIVTKTGLAKSTVAAELKAAKARGKAKAKEAGRHDKKRESVDGSPWGGPDAPTVDSIPRVVGSVDEVVSAFWPVVAVVNIEGKAAVVVRDHDGLRFSSKDSALTWFNTYRLRIEDEGDGEDVPALPTFLNTEHVQVFQGVDCDPTDTLPPHTLNTWRGLAIEPAPGDCPKLKAHILKSICAGNEVHNRVFLDFIAHMFQRPEEKPGFAPVLAGERGTGKSPVCDLLCRIIGDEHSVKISQRNQVVGQFNKQLASKLFAQLEEVTFGADKVAEGPLKDLITSNRIMIERKGIDAYEERSFARFIILANPGHTVPAGAGERRWFVLETVDLYPGWQHESEVRAERKAYFDEIFAEADNGGLAAFLHEMLHRDISGFDRFWAPPTAGLAKQVALSLKSGMRWLHDVLREGVFTLRDGTQVGAFWPLEEDKDAKGNAITPYEIETTDLTDSFESHVRRHDGSASGSGAFLEVLKEVGEPKHRRRVLNTDRRGYLLGGRQAWRKAFTARFGIEFEREDGETEPAPKS
jgi:Bifunctional DNA primase/polymerase, N-terminal/Family of unknown function (DUF5906)